MIFFKKYFYILIIIITINIKIITNKINDNSSLQMIELHTLNHNKNLNNYIFINGIVPIILISLKFQSFYNFFYIYLIIFLMSWLWQKGLPDVYHSIDNEKYLDYIRYIEKSVNYYRNKFKYLKNFLIIINFIINCFLISKNKLIIFFIFHLAINFLIVILFIQEFNLFKNNFYNLLINIPNDDELYTSSNKTIIINTIKEYQQKNMKYIQKNDKNNKLFLYENFLINIFFYESKQIYQNILIKIFFTYDFCILLIIFFMKKIFKNSNFVLISLSLQLIKIFFISQWSFKINLISSINNNKNINKIKKNINQYRKNQYYQLKNSIILVEFIFIFFNLLHKYNHLEVINIPLKIFNESIESVFYYGLKKIILFIIIISYNKKINSILE